MINDFRGEYRFLSNFAASTVDFEGLTYPTVEHAYQAAKTLDLEKRKTILTSVKPGDAKRWGQKVVLRPDWESVKLGVMTNLVQQKFSRHTDLAKKLLATGNEELVEGNTWNDKYWGVCNGVGENHLGKILMSVRKDLRELYDK